MGYLFQIFPDDIDYKLRLLLDIFTLLGIIRVAIWLITILLAAIIGLRVHVISRYFPVNLRSKYGPWALVTGATDGVGLEYCREFAAKGLNLIILGRSQEKLDRVKEELSNGHADIEVVTVQVDLNSDDEQLYHRIEGQIRPGERDIGVVVNNAGVMYDSPNKFLDQQESSIWQQVRVNMLATVMVTRIVLPSMLNRRRGLLINMSSIAAYQPLPLMGLYSASKVFVEWFSESLNIEYAQDGIDVQTLIPNYIATKMTKWSDLLQKPSLSYPSAAAFTHNAVATIGRTSHSCGYWFHDLQHFFTKLLLPNWAYRTISMHFLKHIDNTK
ncbi:hypothetical protein TYRP_012538 [Tyrophagus putrescentiae]|nr:hypothetical protein TYRP_012538 [Tyrophagus putrescentiae]